MKEKQRILLILYNPDCFSGIYHLPELSAQSKVKHENCVMLVSFRSSNSEISRFDVSM